MADVSPPDRGQLFLVGALALAVLLVGLAVLLNAAIFTENLATQETDPGPGDAIEFRGVAEAAGERTMRGVNYHNNSSYSELNTAFERGMLAWGEAAGDHRASQGHVATVTVTGTTEGTRLARDVEGNFTNRTDAANWTVAGDVRVRNFSANVSQSSLTNDLGLTTVAGYRGSAYFRVEFEDDDGDVWTAYVHGDGTNVSVEVIDDTNTVPGADDVCQADPGADGYATVDFTNASVGGRPCSALDFYGPMDEPYVVRFSNATALGSDTARGTFSLVVDEPQGSLDTSSYYDAGDGQPFSTPALYAASVNASYRAPNTDYGTAVRVAPGEPDA